MSRTPRSIKFSTRGTVQILCRSSLPSSLATSSSSRSLCRHFGWIPREPLFAPLTTSSNPSKPPLPPLPTPVFPEPKFTLNRGSLSTKVLEGYKFAVDGSYTEVQYPLSSLKGVHARDFLHLDIFKSISHDTSNWSIARDTRQLPTILPRGNCIIISLSHIKAIVCHDHVFLMDIHRPVVRHFAEFLQTFLHVVQTHANPLLALQTGLHEPAESLDEHLASEKEAENKQLAAALEQSLTDSNAQQQRQNMECPLDFEFRVLEAILSFAVAKYARRIQLYEPVVTDLLKRMIVDTTQIEYDALHRLLPISNSLSVFERSTNEVINVLKDLLANTEDMLEMSLTEKHRRSGQLPPIKQHEECELLLESYLREISHVNQRAFALRRTISTSQDLLNISLDNYRNQIMKVNVKMSFATVGLSVCTVGAGIFGMNLTTGLETDPQAFWLVTATCFSLAGMVYMRLGRLALPQNIVSYPGYEDTKMLAPFLNTLAESDIQDIMLHRLGIEEMLTKERFLEVLEEATGKKMDPVQVDLVFRVFDQNKDNVLSRADLMKFLCDVHNRFTSRSIDGK